MKLCISILILSSTFVATFASNQNPWQRTQRKLIDYPFTVEIIKLPPKQNPWQGKPSQLTDTRPCSSYCAPPKENPWAVSRPALQPPKHNPWTQVDVQSTSSSPLVPRPSQQPPQPTGWTAIVQQNPWRPKPLSKPKPNPWQPSKRNPWQWQ